MQSIISSARTLAQDNDFILMDELLVALTISHGDTFKRTSAMRKTSLCVLLVTHNVGCEALR